MATYKSSFKGSQVDEAVTIANNNLDKGSADTPIFYNVDGYGQVIEKDTIPIVSSVKPLTSGGAYTGLGEVVNNSDVQNQNFIEGDFIKVGSPVIIDRVLSDFDATRFIYKDFSSTLFNFSEPFKVVASFKVSAETDNPIFCLQADEASRQGIVSCGYSKNDKKVFIYIKDKSNNIIANYTRYNYTISAGSIYQAVFEYNLTSYRFYLIDNNGNIPATPLQYTAQDVISSNSQQYYIGYGIWFKYSVTAPTGLNIYLNDSYITVNDKFVYSPYPQSDLPPSQAAVKQYIDTEAATKQPNLEEGYGITLDRTVINLNSDILREGDSRPDLKVNHFEEYAVGSNSEILNRMSEAKRSTFDRDKFTTSAAITEDGIATGTSSSEQAITFNPSIDFTKPFQIDFSFTNNLNALSHTRFVRFGSQIDWSIINLESYDSTTNKYSMRFTGRTAEVGGTRKYAYFLTGNILEMGVEYDFRLKWTGQVYSLYYKEATAEEYITVGNPVALSEPLEVPNPNCRIILRSLMETDLKKFSIEVDGEEIFSGNKTGIDVLKVPNDFTTETRLQKYIYNDGSVDHVIYTKGYPASAVIGLYNDDGSKYTGTDWTFDGTDVLYNGNAATYNSTVYVSKNLDETIDAGVKVSNTGIVSGFTSWSVARIANLTRLLYQANFWEIDIKFTTGSVVNTYQAIIGDATEGGVWKPQFKIEGDSKKLALSLALTSAPTGWQINASGTTALQANTTYFSKIVFTGTRYQMYLSQDNTNWSLEIDVANSYKLRDTNWRSNIGGDTHNENTRGYSAPFYGTIDLSSIKVWADGKLIYQPMFKIPYTLTEDGDKIVDYAYRDRVKSEYDEVGYTPYYTVQQAFQGDFTVVGNPTISNDQIVSGFSSSSSLVDYLTFRSDFLTASTWEILLKIKTGDITSSGVYDIMSSDGSNRMRLLITTQFRLSLVYTLSGSSNSEAASDTFISSNTDYWIKAIFNGSKYSILVSTDGINYAEKISVNSSTKLTYNNLFGLGINIGSSGVTNKRPLLGSIDLKAFKIYADNKLVFPLRSDYTLATVEANDIVDGYLNGTTAYTQRADLSLEQQGTAISGATVQFPKAFSNTNYALTIPYTNKTTTGFTAAATGDWLAEGAIVGGEKIGDNTPLEVYEFIIDQSISDPSNAVSYVGANAGFKSAKMDYTNSVFDWGSWKDTFLYSAFRPCMLKYNGTVDYYLDPNDYTKKLNGAASDVADTTYGGNAMVEFDQIWIKEKNENGKFRISIANSQVDEDYDCWTHMRKDGTLNQYAYRACYQGCTLNNLTRSIAGQAPDTSITGSTMRTQAQSIGAGWDIGEWSQRRLINYLLILMGKSLGSQSVYGLGMDTNASSEKLSSGSLNNKGLFYGYNDTTHGVKVFGIENWWGNVAEWTNGIKVLSGKFLYKMCKGIVDGSTSVEYDTSGTGYIDSGVAFTSNFTTFVKSMKLVPHVGLVPLPESGSNNHYYSDRVSVIYTVSGDYRGGGANTSDGGAGIFFMDLNGYQSQQFGANGCALTYKAQPSS